MHLCERIVSYTPESGWIFIEKTVFKNILERLYFIVLAKKDRPFSEQVILHASC